MSGKFRQAGWRHSSNTYQVALFVAFTSHSPNGSPHLGPSEIDLGGHMSDEEEHYIDEEDIESHEDSHSFGEDDRLSERIPVSPKSPTGSRTGIEKRATDINTSDGDADGGLLPRDKQRRTAFYDYVAEKSMSHQEAKQFFQRHK